MVSIEGLYQRRFLRWSSKVRENICKDSVIYITYCFGSEPKIKVELEDQLFRCDYGYAQFQLT